MGPLKIDYPKTTEKVGLYAIQDMLVLISLKRKHSTRNKMTRNHGTGIEFLGANQEYQMTRENSTGLAFPRISLQKMLGVGAQFEGIEDDFSEETILFKEKSTEMDHYSEDTHSPNLRGNSTDQGLPNRSMYVWPIDTHASLEL